MSNHFWQVQRYTFGSLSLLCMRVDKAISLITTFAVSSNLYYILIQLLHSFQ